jgi:hypothetical protein
VLRKRSPFAQQLSDARASSEVHGRRLSKVPTGNRVHAAARSQQSLRIRQNLGSRQNSFAPRSGGNSGTNSRAHSRRGSFAAAAV